MFRKSLVVTLSALVLAATACSEDQAVSPLSTKEASIQAKRVPARACDLVVPDNYSTIQGAVDDGSPGDRVCVKSGTYSEQIVIDKNLTLVGFDDPVVQAPSSPSSFTIAESSDAWEPVIFVYGGTESGGAVSGPGVSQVSISGLVVDGNDRNPSDRSAGILLRNVRGNVSDNVVQNMHVGSRETFGIMVYGDSEARIEGNEVSDYERGGIGANGDGGPLPDPNTSIANNAVTGNAEIGVGWAPNGIQIGFGATGSITGNTVTVNQWAGSSWHASCILVFESDNIQVQRNTVEHCDTGIGVGAWGWFLPSADNAKLDRNRVLDSQKGISIEVVAYPGFSSSDASVSNTKIVGNELNAGTIGSIGIDISAYNYHPGYDAMADNTKVINNDIDGYPTPIDDEGTESKVHANDPATP